MGKWIRLYDGMYFNLNTASHIYLECDTMGSEYKYCICADTVTEEYVTIDVYKTRKEAKEALQKLMNSLEAVEI